VYSEDSSSFAAKTPRFSINYEPRFTIDLAWVGVNGPEITAKGLALDTF